MLFALYKLKDLPEYLTLSELCYVLDSSNLPKFLSYFGTRFAKIDEQGIIHIFKDYMG